MRPRLNELSLVPGRSPASESAVLASHSRLSNAFTTRFSNEVGLNWVLDESSPREVGVTSTFFLWVGHSGGASLKLFRFLKLTPFFFRAAAPDDSAEDRPDSSESDVRPSRCSANAGAIGTLDAPQPMLYGQIRYSPVPRSVPRKTMLCAVVAVVLPFAGDLRGVARRAPHGALILRITESGPLSRPLSCGPWS